MVPVHVATVDSRYCFQPQPLIALRSTERELRSVFLRVLPPCHHTDIGRILRVSLQAPANPSGPR